MHFNYFYAHLSGFDIFVGATLTYEDSDNVDVCTILDILTDLGTANFVKSSLPAFTFGKVFDWVLPILTNTEDDSGIDYSSFCELLVIDTQGDNLNVYLDAVSRTYEVDGDYLGIPNYSIANILNVFGKFFNSYITNSTAYTVTESMSLPELIQIEIAGNTCIEGEYTEIQSFVNLFNGSEGSTNQPVEESTNQYVEEVVNETTNEYVEKPVEESTNQYVEEVVNEPIEETVSGPVEEVVSGPVEEVVNEPIEETVSGPVEETGHTPTPTLISLANLIQTTQQSQEEIIDQQEYVEQQEHPTQPEYTASGGNSYDRFYVGNAIIEVPSLSELMYEFKDVELPDFSARFGLEFAPIFWDANSVYGAIQNGEGYLEDPYTTKELPVTTVAKYKKLSFPELEDLLESIPYKFVDTTIEDFLAETDDDGALTSPTYKKGSREQVIKLAAHRWLQNGTWTSNTELYNKVLNETFDINILGEVENDSDQIFESEEDLFDALVALGDGDVNSKVVLKYLYYLISEIGKYNWSCNGLYLIRRNGDDSEDSITLKTTYHPINSIKVEEERDGRIRTKIVRRIVAEQALYNFISGKVAHLSTQETIESLASVIIQLLRTGEERPRNLVFPDGSIFNLALFKEGAKKFNGDLSPVLIGSNRDRLFSLESILGGFSNKFSGKLIPIGFVVHRYWSSGNGEICHRTRELLSVFDLIFEAQKGNNLVDGITYGENGFVTDKVVLGESLKKVTKVTEIQSLLQDVSIDTSIFISEIGLQLGEDISFNFRKGQYDIFTIFDKFMNKEYDAQSFIDFMNADLLPFYSLDDLLELIDDYEDAGATLDLLLALTMIKLWCNELVSLDFSIFTNLSNCYSANEFIPIENVLNPLGSKLINNGCTDLYYFYETESTEPGAINIASETTESEKSTASSTMNVFAPTSEGEYVPTSHEVEDVPTTSEGEYTPASHGVETMSSTPEVVEVEPLLQETVEVVPPIQEIDLGVIMKNIASKFIVSDVDHEDYTILAVHQEVDIDGSAKRKPDGIYRRQSNLYIYTHVSEIEPDSYLAEQYQDSLREKRIASSFDNVTFLATLLADILLHQEPTITKLRFTSENSLEKYLMSHSKVV